MNLAKMLFNFNALDMTTEKLILFLFGLFEFSYQKNCHLEEPEEFHLSISLMSSFREVLYEMF